MSENTNLDKLGKEGLAKVWGKFLTALKTVLGDVDISKGTIQEQINHLSKGAVGEDISWEDYQKKVAEAGGELNDGVDYYITDKDPESTYAKNIPYENTHSGLSAQYVQGAIDEVNEKIDTLPYSNPNLLDNPFFTVNQRGQSEYDGSKYCMDRWHQSTNGKCVINADKSVTFSAKDSGDAFIEHMFDKNEVNFNSLKGKTFTATLLKADNTILTTTFTFPTTEPSDSTLIASALDADGNGIRMYYDNTRATNHFFFQIRVLKGMSITVKAVKLELGSVSTLANDVAPDYATELAKCQRYYFCRNMSNDNSSVSCYPAYAFNSNTVITSLQLPVPMRTTPTMKMGTIGERNTDIYTPSGVKIPTEITVGAYDATMGIVMLNNAVSGVTAGTVCSQRLHTNIEFSADL